MPHAVNQDTWEKANFIHCWEAHLMQLMYDFKVAFFHKAPNDMSCKYGNINAFWRPQ